jgi:hypothetical protein
MYGKYTCRIYNFITYWATQNAENVKSWWGMMIPALAATRLFHFFWEEIFTVNVYSPANHLPAVLEKAACKMRNTPFIRKYIKGRPGPLFLSQPPESRSQFRVRTRSLQ